MEAVRKELHFEVLLGLGMLDTAQENLEEVLKLLEELSCSEREFEKIQEKVHKLAKWVNKLQRFLLKKRAEMEEEIFFTTD